VKSNDAVKYVAEYVKETGTPAADATRKLWKDITPIDDPETLLQFAVACRVSTEYRTPFYEKGDEKRSYTPGNGGGKSSTVSVRHSKYEPRVYQVSVTVLQDVHYNVDGRVKAVMKMNRHDALTVAERYRTIREGFDRHIAVMEYIATKLKELKKDHVEDLGDGEKQKIARMFMDLKSMTFPKDLPNLKGILAGKAG
jgi:hypothetical protein